MDLSILSWIGFVPLAIVTVVAVGFFLFCCICLIKDRFEGLGSMLLIIWAIVAAVVAAITGLLVWLIASGGITASNIGNDLRQQGYIVTSINTSDSIAQVVQSGHLTWVYITQDSNGTWIPYTCDLVQAIDTAC